MSIIQKPNNLIQHLPHGQQLIGDLSNITTKINSTPYLIAYQFMYH